MTPEESLAAIRARNPALHAFVSVVDHAPAAGWPFGVKDLIDTADLPTACGSALFAGRRPSADAPVVARLRAAGGVLVGKTLTHELAYGPTGDRALEGACRNPHDPSRMAGGSSAGSAAAVAAGMVPVALGTDTGGSVRIPAALCGVVGFKPTWGALPLDGVLPLAPTLDGVGTLTDTVARAIEVFGLLRGSPVRPRGGRIGWVVVPGNPVVDAVRAFAEGRFGRLSEVRFPLEEIGRHTVAVQAPEAHAQHRDALLATPERFGEEVRARLLAAERASGWAYVRAQRARTAWRADPAGLLGGFDVLALPTTGIPAPRLDERTLPDGDAVPEVLLRWTRPFNLLGWAAVSVPAGFVDGLPVGLQLAAPTDEAVLGAALVSAA